MVASGCLCKTEKVSASLVGEAASELNSGKQWRSLRKWTDLIRGGNATLMNICRSLLNYS
jgi:hypothetical protein